MAFVLSATFDSKKIDPEQFDNLKDAYTRIDDLNNWANENKVADRKFELEEKLVFSAPVAATIAE